MTDKKRGVFLWGLIVLVLLGLGAAYFYALGPVQAPSSAPEEQQQVAATAASSQEEGAPAAQEGASSVPAYEGAGVSKIDVEQALSERILGNPDAPIRIAEYSSFSCGHCGHFHRDTFEKFKKAYIDTGKAYLVFSDFPLNAPALHASMAARCVPGDRYFDFVEILYRDQEQWAYDANYLNILEAKAAENGLPADLFKECVNNAEIRDGILRRMQSAGAQWNVSSTPSFVVNNKIVISGALPFEEFSQKIEDAVAGKIPEEQGPRPSAAPEAQAPESASPESAPGASETPAAAGEPDEVLTPAPETKDETATPAESSPASPEAQAPAEAPAQEEAAPAAPESSGEAPAADKNTENM